MAGTIEHVGMGALFYLAHWIAFLAPCLPACIGFWFLGRTRVRWNSFDFSILVLPYGGWLVACLTHGPGSGLGAFMAGVVSPFAPLIRVSIGRFRGERLLSVALTIVLCIAGYMYRFEFPSMGK